MNTETGASYSALPDKLLCVVLLVIVVVGLAIQAWTERARRREELGELRAMDDTMLADIGLTRSEVEDAYRLGYRLPRSVVTAHAARHPRGP